MKLAKRILRSGAVQGAACALAAFYIRAVHATGRWRVVGAEAPEALWRDGTPFILAFWHGRILMMPFSWPRATPINMLISQHRDGQLIARTVRHFGIDSIAGSTSHGGSAALRAILRALKDGQCVGVTPDGPRGPRMRAAGGAIDIARLSGVPILPAAFATSRRRVLGSWDRFVLAWPFSRGVFVWGAPIALPKDADAAARESARRQLEDGLNAVTAEADRLVGCAAIEPAPAAQPDADASPSEAR